ncbi:uncharacterized protein N7446_013561 [Penicillium canescens]|uniref:Casein kinase II subunit beta n=1 Tax=Penicillium canescens TaxID=5083 RepID=A0AAD6N2I7_PENCN|nr:uncharacterized protein N7446_013561 [Penicillium canescens]KAJ6023201.1 hypothetical protein N7460_013596 [Penicillium canescens]KAJ6025531.1 hypothetical protein N7444_013210 [Penicillium canescens]KAJ6042495.1 hypothetical protein N7446_013561 [Penicillium canescens]
MAFLPSSAIVYFLAISLQGFALRLGRHAVGLMGKGQHSLAARYYLLVYLFCCVTGALAVVAWTLSKIEESQAEFHDGPFIPDAEHVPGPGPDALASNGQDCYTVLDTAQPGIGSGSADHGYCDCSPDANANANLWMMKLIAIVTSAQFVSSRGNEYFCEIDEDYLTDRFNLTGLNTEVSYYQYALDLVTDVFDLDADDDLREQIEKSARHLYGLVHARYIVTTRGLAKMLEKYKKSDFGKCPRVMCDGHALLPVGQSDIPNQSTVKLYCPKCEDIYNPKSSRHASIDGAYFGTSFHSILFQVYPALNPEKSARRYEPRIYGFKVHAAAALARFQDGNREDLKWRLAEAGINHKFVEDSDSDEDAFEYDEEAEAAEPAKAERVIGDAASGRMDIGN